tara:strand:+ start:8271 stop:9101 length:831 start_codon:yes stop_codon:yes gene_type:complete
MKIKHNKKRNTAFVYEALVREGTSAILQKDAPRRNTIVKLIKKHFTPNSLLRKDLECYRSLCSRDGVSERDYARIMHESYRQKSMISADALFAEQTELIKDINKELEPAVFNNFVPNYKSLATIYQLFSHNTSPKDRVLLENMLVQSTMPQNTPTDTTEVDDVLIETFVKKFNHKYDSSLLEEQRVLLTHYIKSFMDNALELKMFVNEEVSRLKNKLVEAKSLEVIVQDRDMMDKTNKLLEKLEGFKVEGPSEEVLTTVLKTQSLVKELFDDGNHN